MHIVYLHGFLSGGKSIKGQILAQMLPTLNFSGTYHAPDYPDRPDLAVAFLQDFFTKLKASGEGIGVFGSSMGGFWASIFAERFDFKAVLINPCVCPATLIPQLSGQEQENPYSHEHFTLTPAHVTLMQNFETELRDHLTPSRYLVLLQDGDEVLDFRQAQSFYQGADIKVSTGGCHAFDNFAAVVPDGLRFLQIH